MIFRIILLLSCLCSLSLPLPLAAQSFDAWKESFWRIAKKQGISENTFHLTMDRVKTPDLSVIKKANYQPEFTTKIWDYLDSRISDFAVLKGQRLAIQYKDVLDEIENRFGVSRYIVLAIWSMESNYGAVLSKTHRLHYVPRALATLAYQDKKRAKFATNQLLALLTMVEQQKVRPDQLMGSWAGAMGHTQFIPSSYQAYGVSIDGTPGVDIWNSIPDALATAASLLAKNGWRTGKTWGYEVIVPHNVFDRAEDTYLINDWEKFGITRTNNRSFPHNDRAILKTLAGNSGPGFLAIKNFFVIKKYNNSDYYALAVGLLADRIAGFPPMQQDWPRPAGSLNANEKYEVQRLLQKQGFYSGTIDGQIGPATRTAIKAFQKAQRIQINGLADSTLLKRLRSLQ